MSDNRLVSSDQDRTRAGKSIHEAEDRERRRIELALFESEERQRIATEAADLGVFEWNVAEDRAVWENDRMYEIFGHSRADGTLSRERFISEYLDPRDADRFKEDFRPVGQPGAKIRTLVRFRRKSDGAVRWIDIAGKVVAGPNGGPPKVVGVIADVTARMQAESALRDSEQRFKSMADAAPAMLWISEPDGSCSFVSRGWCEFTGELESRALGRGWIDTIHPEDRERSVGKLRASKARNEAFVLDYRLRRADGEYRWVIDSGRPRFGADGKSLGYIGSVIDVHERHLAQEALEEREKQLRVITDSTPALISYIDSDLRYRFANRQYEIWFGHDPHVILGRTIPEVLGPAAMESVRPYIERALRGEDIRFEMKVPYAQGGTRWIEATYLPDKAEGGKVRGFFVLVVDVTARKQAEAALRESEERLRFALSNANVGMWDWDVSTGSGHVTPENQRLFGLPETLLNPKAEDYIHLINAEEYDRVAREFIDAAEGRITYDIEYRIRRANDGEERWVHSIGRLTPMPDGVSRFLGISHDITERKRVTEALGESEEKFRTLADNMSQLAWMTDEKGYVFWYNRRWYEYTGTTLEEMQGWGWTRVHHPDHVDRVVEYKNHCLARGILWEDTFPLRGRDGAYRWFLARAVPIRDDKGRITRWFGTKTDVTEQREAARRKDEFLATLAHELRNPLAPIRNAVEILKAKSPPDPQLTWSRDVIDRQVAQMARLLDDLLDVSRITCAKMELRRSRVLLSNVVENAVETSRPLIVSNAHKLEISLPEAPVYLDADPVRLAQVFSNLLNNAAKFTRRGGQIWVTAIVEGSGHNRLVAVSVRDNGIGIRSDALTHIFEMFAQAEPALERSRGGLGIGLSLAKGLVLMHGGTIEARSPGPGQGSEFIVRLPIATDEASPQIAPADAQVPGSIAKCRIIVADDNEDVADSMASVLQIMGHDVRTASDGREALELADEFKPSLIFLDIGMPNLNGYEVARIVRGKAWGRDLKLIALTGWGQEEDKRRAQEAGFDEHMVKPVDFVRLRTLMHEWFVE